MTTLTNSEGKCLTYTNEFIEAIRLQLNSSNNNYTTGDDDILFIKIRPAPPARVCSCSVSVFCFIYL